MKPSPEARIALPIDGHLLQIVEALRANPFLIVHAEPGAGKTTRLPRALLEAGFAQGGKKIAVLEPRRLAAKMAAARVAEECGQEVGQDIGYQYRFEKVGGESTRLWFFTEGLLTRKLVTDPQASDLSVVVLDEFHERHIHSDLALACLVRLQMTTRPDLKIVVMSATLDLEALRAYLPQAQVISVSGRVFPIQTVYWPVANTLETAVAMAVEKIWDAEKSGQTETVAGGYEPGDILVFLPGKGEIRRCEEAVRERLGRQVGQGLEVLPLHGELEKEDQARAVGPSNKRKVILSTNVAESSVTIPGVSVVIDSGQVRQSTVSAFSGISRLELKSHSRASGTQRAGRAGREKPGLCIRLFSKADWEARPHFDPPEIKRADLAQPILELKAQGTRSLKDFPWFESPQLGRLEQSAQTLHRIGALVSEDLDSSLTPFGKKAASMPLHPRLARLCFRAQSLGIPATGRKLAAALQESLLEGALDQEGFARKFPTSHSAERIESTLRSAFPGQDFSPPTDEKIAQAILAGFPDRVGKRRPGGTDYSLSGGGSIPLPESAAALGSSEFVVIPEAAEFRGAQRPGMPNRIRVEAKAWCEIDPLWLFDLEPALVQETESFRFVSESDRIESLSEMKLLEMAISSEKRPPENWDSAARFFATTLTDPKNRGALHRAIDPEKLENWKNRWRFAAGFLAQMPGVSDWEKPETLKLALEKWLYGYTKLSDALQTDFFEFTLSHLDPSVKSAFEQTAPEVVLLSRGRKCRVTYEPTQPPWIESRIQDFFGMKEGPKVGRGQVALTLKLLAPSQRPVQVTQDLAGFWKRAYPEIRRELSRDYPKHKWPEDPLA
ncbi:MAG: ATP-dependent helicase HrpB [Bdellovibrionales bacterium]|nr:ATP-dependent helicase HrpB [Bdellovibrionales bacterium]